MMNEKVAKRIKVIRQILDDYESGKDIKVFIESGRDGGVWHKANVENFNDVDNLFSEFTGNYGLAQ